MSAHAILQRLFKFSTIMYTFGTRFNTEWNMGYNYKSNTCQSDSGAQVSPLSFSIPYMLLPLDKDRMGLGLENESCSNPFACPVVTAEWMMSCVGWDFYITLSLKPQLCKGGTEFSCLLALSHSFHSLRLEPGWQVGQACFLAFSYRYQVPCKGRMQRKKSVHF